MSFNMVRRIKKLLLALLLAGIGIAFGAGLGLFWLGTDSGRAWLTAEIHARSHGTVEIEELQGHPLATWSAKLVRYADAGTSIKATDIRVEWNAWQLLSGRLHLKSVLADKVTANMPSAPTADAAHATWPPVMLTLDHMAVAQLELQQNGNPKGLLSKIAMDSLVLGPKLDGQLIFDIEQWHVQANLGGRLRDWKSDIDAASISGQNHISLHAHGNKLISGSLSLEAMQASAHMHATGDWTQADGVLSSNGVITSEQPPANHTGTWRLHADTGTGATDLAIEGKSTSAKLSRPLDWMLSASYDADGRLHGQLAESGTPWADAAMQMQWEFHNTGQWSAKGTLSRWPVPVKDIEGNLTGVFSAGYQDGDWQLGAGISEGSMNGLAASLDLKARGAGKNWRIEHARMQLLGLTLTGAGQGNEGHLQLTGNLASADIGQLSALTGIHGSGNLQGSFGVSGPPANPEITWQAEGSAIKLDAAEINSVRGQGVLLPNRLTGRATLSAHGVRWQDKIWPSLNIEGKLDNDSMSLHGDARGYVDGAWQMQGKRHADAWQGNLTRMDISQPSKPWLRVRDLPWQMDNGRLQMKGGSLAILGHASSLDADVSMSQLAVELESSQFPLSTLSPWLEPNIRSLRGDAGIKASLTGTWDNPELDMQILANNIDLALANSDAGLAPPRIDRAQVGIHVHRDELRWNASGHMQPAIELTASGEQPWRFTLKPFAFAPAEGQGGKARCDLSIPDLAAFKPWLPRIDPLAGSLKANLVIDQPLGEASMIAQGEFDLPELGIPEFGLDMAGKGRILWNGSGGNLDINFTSGSGTLQARGPFSMQDSTFPELSLTHFPLMNTPDQQLVTDGHLSMRNKDGFLWLQGALKADPLVVLLPDIMPVPTPDLVWEKPKEASAQFEKLQRTRLDVALNLADHGKVSGRGMSLQLGGKLHLGGSVAYPLLTGDLRIISGGIDYRNIHLDVLPDSHVTFTGDPDRPMLHVRAGRKIGDVLVGVIVDGPADRPVSLLFSEPAMAQAEILSYLATGRPLASLGKDNVSDAMSMAGFLLGPGTGLQSVKDKVQHSLGLDSLDVESGAGQGTLAASKRIGSKVTVRLEETVAAEASTAMTLEYQLFKGLSVFAKKIQNLSPIMGLKLSREWQGKRLQENAEAQKQ